MLIQGEMLVNYGRNARLNDDQTLLLTARNLRQAQGMNVNAPVHQEFQKQKTNVADMSILNELSKRKKR